MTEFKGTLWVDNRRPEKYSLTDDPNVQRILQWADIPSTTSIEEGFARIALRIIELEETMEVAVEVEESLDEIPEFLAVALGRLDKLLDRRLREIVIER
jgi:hypothetical protein